MPPTTYTITLSDGHRVTGDPDAHLDSYHGTRLLRPRDIWIARDALSAARDAWYDERRAPREVSP